MKPSETVLLGAGWADGDVYYEMLSLEGGFFELRWKDAQGHIGCANRWYNSWFATRSDIMTVYNSVVVSEDITPAVQRMRRENVRAQRWWISAPEKNGQPTDSFMLDDEPSNCAECFFNNRVCSIHQQEVESDKRRVESMIDKVKEQVAAKKVAQREWKDVLERSKVLTVELIDLLEGVTSADSVLFTASFDGRHSHRLDKPEEREPRDYRIYRWRSATKQWQLTIECKLKGRWNSGVGGFHRLELLEYLLGHETKVVNRDDADDALVREESFVDSNRA